MDFQRQNITHQQNIVRDVCRFGYFTIQRSEYSLKTIVQDDVICVAIICTFRNP
jgi:hypothetical protein